MPQEEDGDAGPGTPGRIQNSAHIGHDRLPASLLCNESEAVGGSGGPVSTMILSQDRVPLLHRRGGEAGVARGMLSHAVRDEDDAAGAGGTRPPRPRRDHGPTPCTVITGGIRHLKGTIDEPFGKPDMHHQARSVVGSEPSKAGLHRVLLRQASSRDVGHAQVGIGHH